MFRFLNPRLPLRSLPSTNAVLVRARGIKTIGLRAEDVNRRWERRSPLIPSAIAQLTAGGTRVLVESCRKRIYRDALFEEAGAEIVNKLELDSCDLVLGIKEIPLDLLPSNSNSRTTHLFFSHTHKAQRSNLPLLQSMLDSKSRFIDYELLTDEKGVRTTAFGYLAGVAGMADGLTQLALKLLAGGVASPLLQLPRPYMFPSLDELRKSLKKVGEEIRENGMGGEEVISLVLAGKGRVGEGARSVLDDIGVEWVSIEALRNIIDSSSKLRGEKKIYACHLELEDYLSRFDGGAFDRESYRTSPADYFSEFDTKVAPYTTLFLNGGFWSKGYPRLLTLEQLSTLKSRPGMEGKMLSIVDVACDYDGALEFIEAPTTICDPTYQLEPATGKHHRSLSAPNSVQIKSVEILPSELPLDASIHFSTSLMPYVESLLADPMSQGKDKIAAALRRATIVEGGQLTEEHRWLNDVLKDVREERRNEGAVEKRKKVLMLGSGLVAGPAVQILTSRPDVALTIASNDLASAQLLAQSDSSISIVPLDASDTSAISALVSGADVVISLLPASLHVRVAECCIESGVHLVTASYVSKEMSALDARAKAAGIVLLNELGLDPGIDHMSAMKLIEEAKGNGNKIDSFVSFCGGLPAPEFSDGLLGYKFSWSPRGVLTAALNAATYRLDTRDISIPPVSLLSSVFSAVPILPGFAFEGIPNRDSVSYLKEYGLSKDLPTILRGTLRFPGFSRVVDVWKKIGLLDMEVEMKLERWDEMVDSSLERISGRKIVDAATRREVIVDIAGDARGVDEAISILKQLSLIPSSHIHSTPLPSLPLVAQSPIDLLSTLLANQLAYEATERDMVVLHHELGTTNTEGQKELFISTMVQYGIPGGHSAMAKTVGMPIALGALLCLDGKIEERGIVSPAHPAIWKPLLRELEKNGIVMKDSMRSGSSGILETLRLK